MPGPLTPRHKGLLSFLSIYKMNNARFCCAGVGGGGGGGGEGYLVVTWVACGLVWGIGRFAAAWVRVRAAFGDG